VGEELKGGLGELWLLCVSEAVEEAEEEKGGERREASSRRRRPFSASFSRASSRAHVRLLRSTRGTAQLALVTVHSSLYYAAATSATFSPNTSGQCIRLASARRSSESSRSIVIRGCRGNSGRASVAAPARARRKERKGTHRALDAALACEPLDDLEQPLAELLLDLRRLELLRVQRVDERGRVGEVGGRRRRRREREGRREAERGEEGDDGGCGEGGERGEGRRLVDVGLGGNDSVCGRSGRVRDGRTRKSCEATHLQRAQTRRPPRARRAQPRPWPAVSPR